MALIFPQPPTLLTHLWVTFLELTALSSYLFGLIFLHKFSIIICLKNRKVSHFHHFFRLHSAVRIPVLWGKTLDLFSLQISSWHEWVPICSHRACAEFQGGSSSGSSSSHPTMYYLFLHDSAVEEVDRGENNDERSNCIKNLLLLFLVLTILENIAEGP